MPTQDECYHTMSINGKHILSRYVCIYTTSSSTLLVVQISYNYMNIYCMMCSSTSTGGTLSNPRAYFFPRIRTTWFFHGTKMCVKKLPPSSFRSLHYWSGCPRTGQRTFWDGSQLCSVPTLEYLGRSTQVWGPTRRTSFCSISITSLFYRHAGCAQI